MRARLGVTRTGFVTTSYEYNAQGQLELVASQGRRFHYAYDEEGKLRSFTRLHGSRDPITESRIYDADGRLLKRVKDPSGSPETR